MFAVVIHHYADMYTAGDELLPMLDRLRATVRVVIYKRDAKRVAREDAAAAAASSAAGGSGAAGAHRWPQDADAASSSAAGAPPQYVVDDEHTLLLSWSAAVSRAHALNVKADSLSIRGEHGATRDDLVSTFVDYARKDAETITALVRDVSDLRGSLGRVERLLATALQPSAGSTPLAMAGLAAAARSGAGAGAPTSAAEARSGRSMMATPLLHDATRSSAGGGGSDGGSASSSRPEAAHAAAGEPAIELSETAATASGSASAVAASAAGTGRGISASTAAAATDASYGAGAGARATAAAAAATANEGGGGDVAGAPPRAASAVAQPAPRLFTALVAPAGGGGTRYKLATLRRVIQDLSYAHKNALPGIMTSQDATKARAIMTHAAAVMLPIEQALVKGRELPRARDEAQALYYHMLHVDVYGGSGELARTTAAVLGECLVVKRVMHLYNVRREGGAAAVATGRATQMWAAGGDGGVSGSWLDERLKAMRGDDALTAHVGQLSAPPANSLAHRAALVQLMRVDGSAAATRTRELVAANALAAYAPPSWADSEPPPLAAGASEDEVAAHAASASKVAERAAEEARLRGALTLCISNPLEREAVAVLHLQARARVLSDVAARLATASVSASSAATAVGLSDEASAAARDAAVAAAACAAAARRKADDAIKTAAARTAAAAYPKSGHIAVRAFREAVAAVEAAAAAPALQQSAAARRRQKQAEDKEAAAAAAAASAPQPFSTGSSAQAQAAVSLSSSRKRGRAAADSSGGSAPSSSERITTRDTRSRDGRIPEASADAAALTAAASLPVPVPAMAATALLASLSGGSAAGSAALHDSWQRSSLTTAHATAALLPPPSVRYPAAEPDDGEADADDGAAAYAARAQRRRRDDSALVPFDGEAGAAPARRMHTTVAAVTAEAASAAAANHGSEIADAAAAEGATTAGCSSGAAADAYDNAEMAVGSAAAGGAVDEADDIVSEHGD
jgi:hypothetical protein